MRQTDDGFQTQFHTVEATYGQHHQFHIQCLGEMSLRTLLKQEYVYDSTTQTKYAGLDDIENLAWIELGDIRYLPYKQQADRTLLVTGWSSNTPVRYRFTSAAEVLQTRRLSNHLIGWLRPFIITDHPNPPMPAHRTDVLRDIVTLLPPLDPKAYARNTVSSMPSLQSYYHDHGITID